MMVLPKIVCPKFHDRRKNIASLLRCQEFPRSDARVVTLPHPHKKQYFLIGLIFGTVPSEITAVCVNRRLPWMQWNCGRFPRAKF